MFTLEQIHTIHAQVKSGADFPQYVQNLKQLGLVAYDLHLADGHTDYRGANNFALSSGPQWPALPITSHARPEALQHALYQHQQGHTDYLTFCHQAAAAGVEKWTVDFLGLTCTYFDQQGHALVAEVIPTP